MGEAGEVTPDGLRRAAAALVKAAWNDKRVATTLLDAVRHVGREGPRRAGDRRGRGAGRLPIQRVQARRQAVQDRDGHRRRARRRR